MRQRAWNWAQERYTWLRSRYWGLHLDAAFRRKAKRPAKRSVR